jgi:hypothetical protein
MNKIGAALVLLLVVSDASAADKKIRLLSRAETLAGEDAMLVVVEEIPSLSKVLTADTIRTETELRLRQSGIQILPFVPNNVASFVVAQVYVNINALPLDRGGFAYAISIELKLPARIRVTDSEEHFALVTAWDTGTMGVTPDQTARRIREVFNDQLSRFLNAYLAANAKK